MTTFITLTIYLIGVFVVAFLLWRINTKNHHKVSHIEILLCIILVLFSWYSFMVIMFAHLAGYNDLNENN